MPLISQLFKDNQQLQSALIKDSAHIVPNYKGECVRLIQAALARLGDKNITGQEYTNAIFGPSTSRAVLNFKTKNRIINFSYQTTPDNIVGKMTVLALDKAMVIYESG